jgi:hypothetical protein
LKLKLNCLNEWGISLFLFSFSFFFEEKKNQGREREVCVQERERRKIFQSFLHTLLFNIYIYIYIYIKNMRNAIHTSKYAFFEVILKIAVRIQKFEINTNH